MKRTACVGLLTACLLAGITSVSPLNAQSADLRAPADRARDPIREVRPTTPADLEGARPMGIIVMMSEHGLQVINPTAPKALGIGEKVLTERIVPQGRTITPSEDPRPYGGLVLIGFEF